MSRIVTEFSPGDRVHLKDATAFYADPSATLLATGSDGQPVVYEVESISGDSGRKWASDDPIFDGPVADLKDVSGDSGHLCGVLVKRLVPIDQ